jgi:type VI secretion system ImpM family protein
LTPCVGCFGKIPQLGDFVTRGLPHEFVESWDGFLRQMIAGSRDALGPQWLDVYLQAPVWRFLLPIGQISQTAVAGVLMPSVDKVARYFPLTIAALLPFGAGGMLRDEWFDRAEALALDALEDSFDPASLTTRVAALGAPLPGDDPLDFGLWETFGSQAVAAMALRARRLPEGAECAALLDGDCARWGWSVEKLPLPALPSEAAQPA